jgi:uncharacterized membrane protein
MREKRGYLTDFGKGVIFVALCAIIITLLIVFLTQINKRDKELIEYAKKQVEIEALREDYINRDPDEFLEIPDVRRAADGAADEFDRKRDEILQRFRSGIAN